MDIRETHQPLSEVAALLGRHHNRVYADAVREGWGLVRENGEWWLPKEIGQGLRRRREDRLAEMAGEFAAGMRSRGLREDAIAQELAQFRDLIARNPEVVNV